MVVSTAGKVFISLDLTLRISLASDEEGYSMLASNGNTKPLLTSLGLPPRRYLQTGGKEPEGFAPSFPTFKVGDFLLVHNAHS